MTFEEYLGLNALGGLMEHSLRVEDFVGGKPRLSVWVNSPAGSQALVFVAVGNTLVALSRDVKEEPPGAGHDH